MKEQDTPHPSLTTRLKVTSALAIIGGLCGAVAGTILTYLGNVISGYSVPPTIGIYASNAGIFAAIGATLGPPMVWSMLRAVPLWRTLVEPTAAALAASVLAMIFAPSLFVAAVPVAIFGAALRLRWEYRNAESLALRPGAGASAIASPSTGTNELPDVSREKHGQRST